MKQTAIIYCRKSTDREGRQDNTHITQLEKCRRVCEIQGFVILDEIIESVSAKESWTRKGFNKFLEYWESWKVDYLIIDEADRLSRDDKDTANFTTMLRKWTIMWIYVNWREIRYDDDYAINGLWNQLWLAKLDNWIRSKKVKKNMQTALNRWKWLSQAIFWYRNVWDRNTRWIKTIDEEANLIVEAFRMRTNQVSFRKIADFLESKTNIKWTTNRVSAMIKNPRYYWMQPFWWWEAKIDTKWYRPIITKTLFDKANNISVATPFESKTSFIKHFKGILKDTDWQNYYASEKTKKSWKKYYYYSNSNEKSTYYLNINENFIFDEFEKHIDNYNFPEVFQKLSRMTLKEHFNQKTKEITEDKKRFTRELNKLENRLSNLKNKWLDDKINDEEYRNSKEDIENEIDNIKESKEAIKQWEDNIIEDIEDFLELSKNLSESYKNSDKLKKAKIIRLICLELILDNKKQLTIKENKLFEIIKSFNCNEWYARQDLNPRLT